MEGSYRKLVGIARGVLRKAEEVVSDLSEGKLSVVGSGVRVVAQELKLKHFGPLVKRVIEQTRARVFGGDARAPTRSSSIFEEHTQVIRKGKAHKPTRVKAGRSHQRGRERRCQRLRGQSRQFCGRARLGARAHAAQKEVRPRAKRIATGDRGFYSAANDRAASELGVKKVALPFRGKRSATRRKQEKQPWFRRALRWRGGIEGRIGTLKHRFDMERARYKGDAGFKRSVGFVSSRTTSCPLRALVCGELPTEPRRSRTSPPTQGASPSTRRTVAA